MADHFLVWSFGGDKFLFFFTFTINLFGYVITVKNSKLNGKLFFFFFLEKETILDIHWIEIEFVYKASTAGQGESSSQMTSLKTFLAYLTNEWVTELALRLA